MAIWGMPFSPIKNFWSWLKSYFGSITSDINKASKYSMSTVLIDDHGIGMTQFNLSKKQQHALKKSGAEAMESYRKNYLEDSAYTFLEYNSLDALKNAYKIKSKIYDLLMQSKTSEDREYCALLKLELTGMKSIIKQYHPNFVSIEKDTNDNCFACFLKKSIDNLNSGSGEISSHDKMHWKKWNDIIRRPSQHSEDCNNQSTTNDQTQKLSSNNCNSTTVSSDEKDYNSNCFKSF